MNSVENSPRRNKSSSTFTSGIVAATPVGFQVLGRPCPTPRCLLVLKRAVKTRLSLVCACVISGADVGFRSEAVAVVLWLES